jgi:hypothetical protein
MEKNGGHALQTAVLLHIKRVCGIHCKLLRMEGFKWW